MLSLSHAPNRIPYTTHHTLLCCAPQTIHHTLLDMSPPLVKSPASRKKSPGNSFLVEVLKDTKLWPHIPVSMILCMSMVKRICGIHIRHPPYSTSCFHHTPYTIHIPR
ncbi:hypothetical protein EON63_20805 [archaeon]|nr:MAG: hypothetical protein EON63_20805 [archaeon]